MTPCVAYIVVGHLTTLCSLSQKSVSSQSLQHLTADCAVGHPANPCLELSCRCMSVYCIACRRKILCLNEEMPLLICRCCALRSMFPSQPAASGVPPAGHVGSVCLHRSRVSAATTAHDAKSQSGGEVHGALCVCAGGVPLCQLCPLDPPDN